MAETQNHFEFTGALYQEGKLWVAVCLEVDVASQGRTAREARKMLAEAVTLYLETCFEDGIPFLRPVPREDDPRFHPPKNLLEIFPLKVDFKVHAFV
jgi:predicted RNase H-like HicB family nuclease